MTSQMGQAGICMGKETALGRRNTTLAHRHTFTQTIIPGIDKSLDEEGMMRLQTHMQKAGATLMSDKTLSSYPLPSA